jgi:hypothetical protein
MTTKYWKYADCADPECETSDAQHKHRVYAPRDAPQQKKAKLQLQVCQNPNCKDIRPNQIHCHQGDLETGTGDWVEANTLDRAREIEKEQSINMTAVTSIKEKEYVVLSLKDTKDESKPIEEPQQGQPSNLRRNYYNPWEPYGQFTCLNSACPKQATRWNHEHFQNFTKEERDQAGIAISPNQFQRNLGCGSKECEDRDILRNHIHLQDSGKGQAL